MRAGKPQVVKSPGLDKRGFDFILSTWKVMRASVDKMRWRMGRKQGMGVRGSLKLTKRGSDRGLDLNGGGSVRSMSSRCVFSKVNL